MIVQPGETSIIVPFAPTDAAGAPINLAFDTAGLVAEYKTSRQNAWTPIAPLVAGTLGTWINKGIISDGNGYTELGLPDGIPTPPTIVDSIHFFVVVRLRLAGMICPPVRLDYRGVPFQMAGSRGGLVRIVLGVGGDGGDIQSHAVGIKGTQYFTITDLLQKIWAKVSSIGVSAWKSLTGKFLGPFEVTIGDTMSSETGYRILFAFVGFNDISAATIKGQLRYKNGEKIADLTGEMKTASADPAVTQEAYVNITAADYTDAWLPSREGREHEVLCQIEYSPGVVVTPGRADVVLLRG